MLKGERRCILRDGALRFRLRGEAFDLLGESLRLAAHLRDLRPGLLLLSGSLLQQGRCLGLLGLDLLQFPAAQSERFLHLGRLGAQPLEGQLAVMKRGLQRLLLGLDCAALLRQRSHESMLRRAALRQLGELRLLCAALRFKGLQLGEHVRPLRLQRSQRACGVAELRVGGGELVELAREIALLSAKSGQRGLGLRLLFCETCEKLLALRVRAFEGARCVVALVAQGRELLLLSGETGAHLLARGLLAGDPGAQSGIALRE